MVRPLEILLLLFPCAICFPVSMARAQQVSFTLGRATASNRKKAPDATEVTAAAAGADPQAEIHSETLPFPGSVVSASPFQESRATVGNQRERNSHEVPEESLQGRKREDFNQGIYYKNKLEFALDVGWLPINIPFPLDFMTGDPYNTYPLRYTLVPVIASVRWQLDDVGGPSILRGNWDATFSGSATAIPRGPETRYFSYDMGVRRNFVPRNWRAAPYFDLRFGVGNIDAKGPDGVMYAQGQDLTFTLNAGSGVRYNFSSEYAISLGLNYMHISNANLSQSNGKPNWGVRNYGINVYGPMIGIDIRLGR